MLLQNAIADALNNTEWAFALAECVHIGGFAVGVGSIALVDFRMLNLGMRGESSARILLRQVIEFLAAKIRAKPDVVGAVSPKQRPGDTARLIAIE